jgi:hypothetical protein
MDEAQFRPCRLGVGQQAAKGWLVHFPSCKGVFQSFFGRDQTFAAPAAARITGRLRIATPNKA